MDRKTNLKSITGGDPLKPVVVTAQAPRWLQLEREYQKANPISKKVDAYLNPLAISLGNSKTNYPARIDEEYKKETQNYVAQKLIEEGNTKFGKDKLGLYNSLSPKEKNIINTSDHANKFLPATRAYDVNQSDQAKKYGLVETLKDPGKLAQSVQGTPDRFRLFPNAENNIEDMLNPFVQVGQMAKTLGQAPLKAKQQGSVMPIVKAIAEPLAVGAMFGLGPKANTQPLAQVEKTIVKNEPAFTNRVWDSNIQLGTPLDGAHISELGYNYRILSEQELKAIKDTGKVLPREGKQKGGNINTKYWTKGNEKNWYGENTIRVKHSNFDMNSPVNADHVEVFNKNTNQFEPLNKPEFKSEINWGAWNEGIPKNKNLLEEYHNIEQTTKADGTWMKPLRKLSGFTDTDAIMLKNSEKYLADGEVRGRPLTDNERGVLTREVNRLGELKKASESYDGTPEQFVQELSSNFKKAFPERETTFRGGSGNRSFRGSLASSDNKNVGSVFTAEKDAARHYGSNRIVEGPNDTNNGLLELLYNKSPNSLDISAKGNSWSAIPRELIPAPHSDKIKNLSTVSPQVSTDDISRYLQDSNVDYAKINNIFDGVPISKEVIFNHKEGNYLKSRWYNNGMFDMTDPNIYMGVGGAAAAVEAVNAVNKNKNLPPAKKEVGGVVNSTSMDPQAFLALPPDQRTAYLHSLSDDQRLAFVQTVQDYETSQNPDLAQGPAAAASRVDNLTKLSQAINQPSVVTPATPATTPATGVELDSMPYPGATPSTKRGTLIGRLNAIEPNNNGRKPLGDVLKVAGGELSDKLGTVANVATSFMDMANISDPGNAEIAPTAIAHGAAGLLSGGPIGGIVGAITGALSAGSQREAFEQQEALRNRRSIKGLRMAPTQQETGGVVSTDSEIEIPVQEEEGEVMLLPNGKLVDSMATETHKQMKGKNANKVTDVIPSGTMIFSNSKKRIINLAKIKDDILTITRGHYSEDGNVPGETITMGDVYGTKGKVTPADLAKKVRKMYPIIEEPMEQIEVATNAENMRRRAELLLPIMRMQEGIYKKFEYDKPVKYETGGVVKKKKAIIPKYGDGTDECGIGYEKDANGDCVPKLMEDKAERDKFLASFPTYEARAAYLDQAYQNTVKDSAALGITLPAKNTPPPTGISIQSDPSQAEIGATAVGSTGATPQTPTEVSPEIGTRKSVLPRVSDDTFAAGDKLIADQIPQIESDYKSSTAASQDLYRSQRFRNVAILASKLAGNGLQNGEVTPVIQGTEHIDSMFPRVTESQINAQVDPVRQGQNRTLQAINDSGINGGSVGSAIASTQARLIDNESQVRNRALTVNQSQDAKRLERLKSIIDTNNANTVGAENATRSNRNQLISNVSTAASDSINAGGGLKEALNNRMDELKKWRQENMNSITQSQYDNLVKKEQTRIDREYKEKMEGYLQQIVQQGIVKKTG